ncbi:MAG: FeoB-associated Cys-rich membrane protein [Arcobacteraceae bacterium]
MADNIFLAALVLGALYILYIKLVKSNGCDGCGGNCEKKE